MKTIWYLLKCPEGDEADYARKCWELLDLTDRASDEVICFQYQRMLRYRGEWHLEKKIAMPGCIFLAGTNVTILKKNMFLTPCETPYLKELCQDGILIEISKGTIRNGVPVVTSGPLKGRERLIRRIDRHKRIAEIEIPFVGEKRQVTVGLEIYKKEI